MNQVESVHKGRRTKIVLVGLVIVFVAGAIAIAVHAEKSKPRGSVATVTPASIYKAMKKWCSTYVVVDYGVQQVRQHFSREHGSGATDAMYCFQNSVPMEVLFFRTSFDERHYLDYFSNGMSWSGTSAKSFSNPVLISVGRGFTAYFGWPKKGQATTEGQVVDWMTETFGVQPKASDWKLQDWNQILPAITNKSIGAPGPLG